MAKFIPEQWPQYTSIFSGSPDGLMRSSDNLNDNPLVTRFPLENMKIFIKNAAESNGTVTLPFASTNITVDSDFFLAYPAKNYQRCLDAKK